MDVPQVKTIEYLLRKLKDEGINLNRSTKSKLIVKAIHSNNPDEVYREETARYRPSRGSEPSEVKSIAIAEHHDLKGKFFVELGALPDGNSSQISATKKLLWECHNRFGLTVEEAKAMMQKAKSISELQTDLQKFKDPRETTSRKISSNGKKVKEVYRPQSDTSNLKRGSESNGTKRTPSFDLNYFMFDGKVQFNDWLDQQGQKVKKVVGDRLTQLESGNFVGSIKIEGVPSLFVSIIHQHGSPRIYYLRRGQEVIVLLGGNSHTEKRDSKKAAEWANAILNSKK